jgi:hypothetical protein
MAWLEKHGATGLSPDRLSWGPSDEGVFGCFAAKDFAKDEVLFEVPLKCLFGIDNIPSSSSSKIASRIRKTALDLGEPTRCTSELLIWLGMIEARNDSSSHYYSYFQSLDDISPNILEWPERLTNVIAKIRPQMVNGVNDMLNRHSELLQLARQKYHLGEKGEGNEDNWLPESVFNRESLLWAYGHYVSRRYPGKYGLHHSHRGDECPDGRETALENLGVLVPALDILNHGDGSVQWLRLERSEEQTQTLQVICNVPRKRGQEMYSNYGSLSNEKLLFAYGFALKNNPFDEVALHLVVGSSNAPPTDYGITYLTRGGIQDGVPPHVWKVLQTLRDEEDEDEEEEGEGEAIQIDAFELDLLKAYVQRLMSKFTNDADISAIFHITNEGESGVVDIREQWIRSYIQGQKDVLNQILDDTNASLGEEEDEEEEEE